MVEDAEMVEVAANASSLSESLECPSECYFTADNNSHFQKINSKFDEFRKHGIECDLTIAVDDRTFQVHKLIMRGSSQYFQHMFSIDMIESKSNEKHVELKGVSADIMEIIINLCCMSSLKIKEDQIMDLLIAADMLQFDFIKELCEDQLMKIMKIDNCVRILKVANQLSICSLIKEASRFIGYHWHLNSLRVELMDISFNCLKNLFTENVSALNGPVIHSILLNWCEHDIDSRRKYLLELLKLIDINTKGSNIVSDIENGNSSKSMTASNCSQMYAIGRDDKGDSIFCYDYFNDKWIRDFQSKPRQTYTASCSYQKKIYICNSYGKMERFDTEDKKSVECKKLIRCINNFGFCECNGWLYAVGGIDDYSFRCSSVEVDVCSRYNPRIGIWYTMNSLPVKRSSMELISHNGCIYSIGGTSNEKNIINSTNGMLKYDTRIGKWDMIPGLPTDLCEQKISSFSDDNYIYAWNLCIRHPLYKYDIRSNGWIEKVEANEWLDRNYSQSTEVKYGLQNAVTMALFQNRLLMFGCYSGKTYINQCADFQRELGPYKITEYTPLGGSLINRAFIIE